MGLKIAIPLTATDPGHRSGQFRPMSASPDTIQGRPVIWRQSMGLYATEPDVDLGSKIYSDTGNVGIAVEPDDDYL